MPRPHSILAAPIAGERGRRHIEPVLCRNWIDENDPEIAGLARFGGLDGAGSGAESGTRS